MFFNLLLLVAGEYCQIKFPQISLPRPDVIVFLELPYGRGRKFDSVCVDTLGADAEGGR